jgi:U32 family peptidase
MPDRKPELLAPAGSFMAGYYAFEAGADAVYVGLRHFSARGSAQNFNHLELGKLKTLARLKNKKIYVALNTVIREEETDDFTAVLVMCERLDIDGILVQDAGALAIARKHFPGLTVHASTQMALHNAAGLREAARLGIKRVVLPRELSFDRIKSLREQFPDIELEVFIHGALCYSYSGLCLASGLMGGGSGNRGACAQVCRLRFEYGGREGNFLSCRDLFSGLEARRLAEAGVDSLKIEGRLKSAPYVYHTVRLYRFILDHDRPEEEPEYEALLAHSGFVFSRERTRGRLFGGPDERLVTERYERSVGFPIGRVAEISASSFSFAAGADIALDDVLQCFLDEKENRPFKLPVRKLTVGGKAVAHSAKGDFVTVASGKVPAVGQEISKVYARDLELPGIRHRQFAPYAPSLPVNIHFSYDAPATVTITASLDGRAIVFTHPVSFEKAESREENAHRIQQAFARTKESTFHFVVKDILYTGSTPPEKNAIGNRQLKKIRDSFAGAVAQAEAEQSRERCFTIHETNRLALADRSCFAFDGIRTFIQNRKLLNPPASPHALFPFYPGGRPTVETLARMDDSVFIPLMPIIDDDETGYYCGIERFLRENTQLTIYIGINNIHHLAMAREWEQYPNVYSFIDFFFYLANASAIRFVLEPLTKIAFGYYWIEGTEEDRASLERATGFPLIGTGKFFQPPYFIHAGDFPRESLGRAADKTGEPAVFELRYGKFRFEAVIKNGCTYIYGQKN